MPKEQGADSQGTMKVAVASSGKDMSAGVHETFGRCPWFLIIDIDGGRVEGFKAMENTGLMRAGGVGISSAQIVAELGVDAVIAGRLGPRAMDILKQFGISVYIASGTAEEAVGKLIRGELEKATYGGCDGHNSACGEHG